MDEDIHPIRNDIRKELMDINEVGEFIYAHTKEQNVRLTFNVDDYKFINSHDRYKLKCLFKRMRTLYMRVKADDRLSYDKQELGALYFLLRYIKNPETYKERTYAEQA